MLSTLLQSARDLKTYDDTRDSIPGEHWLVFGAGIALLIAANRAGTPTLHRALGTAAGAALIARAASGRDGVAKLGKYLPNQKGLLR